MSQEAWWFSRAQIRICSRANPLPFWRIGDDVTKCVGGIPRNAVFGFVRPVVNRQSLYAQPDDEHGHSIGRVSTRGDLLAVELDVGLISAAEVPDFLS
jgi:hypothetical protein